MANVKLTEEFFPGQYEFNNRDWHVAAWEAPSGSGITCMVGCHHYPFTSTAIRGLSNVGEAETAASNLTTFAEIVSEFNEGHPSYNMTFEPVDPLAGIFHVRATDSRNGAQYGWADFESIAEFREFLSETPW
jgi:hypothetical protein